MVPKRAQIILLGLVSLSLCLPFRLLQVCAAGDTIERTTRPRGGVLSKRALRTDSEPLGFTDAAGHRDTHWRELLEGPESDIPGPDLSDIIGRPLIMDGSDSGNGNSAGSGGAVQGEGNGGGGGARQKRIPEVLLYPTCTDTSRGVYMRIGPDNALSVPWEGWGTTLSFIGRFVGGLERPYDRKRLLRLIFDPNIGLGLTRVRYMMSPSLLPANSPAVVRWNQDRDYTAYSPSPGVFNWSADWKQVQAMKDAIAVAAEANRSLHVDAIALSPPWYMTVTGDVAGGVNGSQNIDQSNMTGYAYFLLSWVQQMATQQGLRVETISPMNEPLEGWWKAGSAKVGCSFNPVGAREMYEAMAGQRQAMGMEGPVLVGADSWPNHTTTFLSTQYSKATLPFAVATIHSYYNSLDIPLQEWGQTLSETRSRAESLGLRLWQTEWGPLGIPGTDMDIALFMARRIIEDINILGVSAWSHFLALHRANPLHWGAVQVNLTAGEPLKPVKTRQFSATLHYTRLIPEGSIILKIPQKCQHGVLAAYSPERNHIIVTAANQRNKTFSIQLSFRGFEPLHPLKPMTLTTHFTNYFVRFQVIGQQKRFSFWRNIDLYVQRRSITSIVISNVKMSDK